MFDFNNGSSRCQNNVVERIYTYGRNQNHLQFMVEVLKMVANCIWNFNNDYFFQKSKPLTAPYQPSMILWTQFKNFNFIFSYFNFNLRFESHSNWIRIVNRTTVWTGESAHSKSVIRFFHKYAAKFLKNSNNNTSPVSYGAVEAKKAHIGLHQDGKIHRPNKSIVVAHWAHGVIAKKCRKIFPKKRAD